MDRRKQIIAAVLVLIAAGLWLHGLSGRRARTGPSGRSGGPSTGSTPSPSADDVQHPPLAAPAQETQPWGGSPFLDRRDVQPSVTADAKEGLVLNGIVWDAQAPSAVINDRVLSPGDRIDQWEVVEIQKDRVVLSDGQATQTLEAR